jgi:hypothetical protein
MKSLRYILEGILDIEGTMSKGDDMNKQYLKAEKAYDKLTSPEKFIVTGQYYAVRITSRELAYFIGEGIPAFEHFKEKYNINEVVIMFDILSAREHNADLPSYAQINLNIKRGSRFPLTVAAAHLVFCNPKDKNKGILKDIKNDKGGQIAEKLLTLFKAKFKTAIDIKEAFEPNIRYTAKY